MYRYLYISKYCYLFSTMQIGSFAALPSREQLSLHILIVVYEQGLKASV